MSYVDRINGEEMPPITRWQDVLPCYKKAYADAALLQWKAMAKPELAEWPVESKAAARLHAVPSKLREQAEAMLRQELEITKYRPFTLRMPMGQGQIGAGEIDCHYGGELALETLFAESDRYLGGEITAQEYRATAERLAETIVGTRRPFKSGESKEKEFYKDLTLGAMLQLPSAMKQNAPWLYSEYSVDLAKLQAPQRGRE